MPHVFADYRLIAGEIARQNIGGAIKAVRKLHGGVVNHVFRVDCGATPLVVRMNADSLDVYRKECWAMSQAAAVGVNVPAVHAVGTRCGMDYMLMDAVEGEVLREQPQVAASFAEDLGRQARLLNGIAVEGFGFHLFFSPDGPRFTQSWDEVVATETEMIFGEERLERMGALTRKEIAEAREFLAPLSDRRPEPRLCHGDLHPGNVIGQASGRCVLLDWTGVTGGYAPVFDVSRVWSSAPALFDRFRRGYGLSDQQLSACVDDIKRIQLKDALRAAAWAHSVEHAELHRFADDAPQSLARCVV